MKIERHILEHGCINDRWPYPDQDLYIDAQLETSSILKSPTSGLKGHRVSYSFKIKTDN